LMSSIALSTMLVSVLTTDFFGARLVAII
jgi:hypothetical protein